MEFIGRIRDDALKLDVFITVLDIECLRDEAIRRTGNIRMVCDGASRTRTVDSNGKLHLIHTCGLLPLENSNGIVETPEFLTFLNVLLV